MLSFLKGIFSIYKVTLKSGETRYQIINKGFFRTHTVISTESLVIITDEIVSKKLFPIDSPTLNKLDFYSGDKIGKWEKLSNKEMDDLWEAIEKTKTRKKARKRLYRMKKNKSKLKTA